MNTRIIATHRYEHRQYEKTGILGRGRRWRGKGIPFLVHVTCRSEDLLWCIVLQGLSQCSYTWQCRMFYQQERHAIPSREACGTFKRGTIYIYIYVYIYIYYKYIHDTFCTYKCLHACVSTSDPFTHTHIYIYI